MGRRLLLRVGTTCNSGCAHCTLVDVRDAAGAAPDRRDAQVLDALVRGRADGCDEVVFLRGEATLRRGLPAWLRRARTLGYRHLQLQTNARALAIPGLLDGLVAAGLGAVEASLYGPDAAVHDAVAATQGAFEQTCAGIRAAAARDLQLLVNVPIVSANLDHLPETVRLAARLGARSAHLLYTRPAGPAYPAQSATVPAPGPTGEAVRQALEAARDAGIAVWTEGVPACLSGAPDAASDRPHGGPTPVIDDLHRRVTHLDALRDRYRAFGRACASCGWRSGCAGLWRETLAAHGDAELVPQGAPPATPRGADVGGALGQAPFAPQGPEP